MPPCRPNWCCLARPPRGFIVLLLAASCLLLSVGRAWAGEGKIVVVPFQGAKKIGIRAQVVGLLQAEGYDVVPDDSMPDVDPAGSEHQFVRRAAAGGFRAFVMGFTKLTQKSWTTSLTVREGKTGKVVGRVAISAGWYPGLQKALDQQLIPRISGPLQRAQPPEAAVEASHEGRGRKAKRNPSKKKKTKKKSKANAAEETEAPNAPQADDAKAEAPRDHRKPRAAKEVALEFDAGPLFMRRAWKLHDQLDSTFDRTIAPTHDVSLLGVSGALTIFPVAFSGTGFMRHIGARIDFSRSLMGSTATPDTAGPDERETVFQELSYGIKVRIPVGRLRFGVYGGLGTQLLSLEGEKDDAAQPDARYDFFHAGADVSVPFGQRFSARLAVAYRGLLSLGTGAGEIQADDWFPDATGAGISGRLSANYLFSDLLGITAGARVRQYGLELRPDVASIEARADAGQSAPPVAGGASDLYLGGDIGLLVLVR